MTGKMVSVAFLRRSDSCFLNEGRRKQRGGLFRARQQVERRHRWTSVGKVLFTCVNKPPRPSAGRPESTVVGSRWRAGRGWGACTAGSVGTRYLTLTGQELVLEKFSLEHLPGLGRLTVSGRR